MNVGVVGSSVARALWMASHTASGLRSATHTATPPYANAPKNVLNPPK